MYCAKETILYPGTIQEVKTFVEIQIPKGFQFIIKENEYLEKRKIHLLKHITFILFCEIVVLFKNESLSIYTFEKSNELLKCMLVKRIHVVLEEIESKEEWEKENPP